MIIGTTLVIATVVIVLLMVLKPKTTVASRQKATATIPLLRVIDEFTFESLLQPLIDELSPMAIFYIKMRADYFEARRRCLNNRYSEEQLRLTVLLTDLFNNLPKTVTRSQRFKKIRKALLFDIACEEPLRFFTVVQHVKDEYSFIRLYNLILEKGYEEKCRDKLQSIASSYCTLRFIISTQNKVETEYEQFQQFLKSNALLIKTIDS